MKLLVIDDQEEVGELIGEIAQGLGWETVSCTDFNDVAETIAREKVDLLFLDYFMPEKNGLDVLTDVRAQQLNVLTILCSGMVSEIDFNRAKKLGIYMILEKPIGIDRLRELLMEAESYLTQSKS